MESGEFSQYRSQGYPDFDALQAVIQAAVDAISGGINQYTITWGYPELRNKLAERYTKELGWAVDPDVHVTITCGVTEGIVVALEAPGYRLDTDKIAAAMTSRTRAIVLNTPHNPTGRLFDSAEIGGLVELIETHDLALITDEIYDRILYDGRTCPPAALKRYASAQ